MPADGLMVEPKVDGWRCLYFAGVDGQPRLWSRQGMPLEGAAHVLARLQAIEAAAGVPLFIDGEIQVGGSLSATKAWFETGWRQGGEAGLFHAFDCLSWSDWHAGGSDQPLYQRKARLRELFAGSEEQDDGWTWRAGSKGAPAPEAVRIMPDGWAFDAADVLDQARRIWTSGGEGIMLKDPMSPYRRLRSGVWQKVKMENAHKWRMAA